MVIDKIYVIIDFILFISIFAVSKFPTLKRFYEEAHYSYFSDNYI